MIKVLHISETFAAGVYTYIKDVCKYMEQYKDIESFVIYSDERKETRVKSFKTDYSEKITLVKVKMKREISLTNDIKAIQGLISHIRRIDPDIIHLHSSKAGVLGRIAAKFHRKSTIFYTPHGYSFFQEDISKNKRNLYRSIEKYVQYYFGGITIACGDTEYIHALKMGKSILIRNGVDIKTIEKFKTKKQSSILTIGSMGRLSFQKNPKLFNKIALKFPEVNFVWVGDGELKNEITAKNIFITGWLEREKALKIVNTFDIYIQTSLWEGLPFTIIEAMVLGKSIIASDVVGNKDAVKHAYNGFLCDSEKDFCTSLKTLIDSDALRSKMSINSKLRASKLFDKNINFKKVYKIYKDSASIL